MFLLKIGCIRRFTSCVAEVKPLELVPAVLNYEWGKLGLESYVATLAFLNNDTKICADQPYAELWMGDHVKGLSKIKGTDYTLKDKLEEKLSFLFKVLSIRKPLSLQIHPNKEDAEFLHKLKPDIYKDANYKPEIAIAITPFEVLTGFRHPDEIHQALTEIVPLKEYLGQQRLEKLKSSGSDSLREIFQKVITLKPNCAAFFIEEMSKKYCKVLEDFGILDVFEKLKEEFPNDVGVLSLLFMNYIKLVPGQAIYIKPNQPHSYLFGDCIECMATSDNIIRAAFTSKSKDVKQFLKSANFTHETPEELKIEPFVMDKIFHVFSPPVCDFAVVCIVVPEEEKAFRIPSCLSGSILLITTGKCILKMSAEDEIRLSPGSVLYLPENCESFKLTKSQDNFIFAFLAMPNRFI